MDGFDSVSLILVQEQCGKERETGTLKAFICQIELRCVYMFTSLTSEVSD